MTFDTVEYGKRTSLMHMPHWSIKLIYKAIEHIGTYEDMEHVRALMSITQRESHSSTKVTLHEKVKWSNPMYTLGSFSDMRDSIKLFNEMSAYDELTRNALVTSTYDPRDPRPFGHHNLSLEK